MPLSQKRQICLLQRYFSIKLVQSSVFGVCLHKEKFIWRPMASVVPPLGEFTSVPLYCSLTGVFKYEGCQNHVRNCKIGRTLVFTLVEKMLCKEISNLQPVC